jgi:hypothetical protein
MLHLFHYCGRPRCGQRWGDLVNFCSFDVNSSSSATPFESQFEKLWVATIVIHLVYPDGVYETGTALQMPGNQLEVCFLGYPQFHTTITYLFLDKETYSSNRDRRRRWIIC